MRCLVTGGSGFIGSHVVEALERAGHEVFVHDLSATRLDGQPPTAKERVFQRCLLPDSIAQSINDCRPQFLFHLAAWADARRCLENPFSAMLVNVAGTAAVLEGARNQEVERVVLASTCWVANAMGYGVLTEESLFSPAGGGHLYTTSKIASEMLLHDAQTLWGQNFTILRYGIPYGERMWPGLVLANWLERAKERLPLVIYGDGSNVRQFVHVKDLARAHVAATHEIALNQTYNLEGSRPVSIKELAELFQNCWGEVEIEYREEPKRVGEFGAQHRVVSAEKARIELLWEPKVTIETGVHTLIAEYKMRHGLV